MGKERAEFETEIANECKAIEGATDEDMECYNSYEMPTTPTGKGLHACIQEKMELVGVDIVFFYRLR